MALAICWPRRDLEGESVSEEVSSRQHLQLLGREGDPVDDDGAAHHEGKIEDRRSNPSVTAVSRDCLRDGGDLRAIDAAPPRSYLSRLRGRKPPPPAGESHGEASEHHRFPVQRRPKRQCGFPCSKTVRAGCKPIARSGEER
jgi:hypothetical protein